MKRLETADDLRVFANVCGIAGDWHEPDEAGITARVEGLSFDNAGYWPADDPRRTRPIDPLIVELHVIFSDSVGNDLACVNLATLCSWAAR